MDPSYGLLVASGVESSSETQGQLVRQRGFSLAKVNCKNETSPWAITLIEPVLEAFEFPAFDWAKNAQSKAGNSNASGTGSVRVIAQGLVPFLQLTFAHENPCY